MWPTVAIWTSKIKAHCASFWTQAVNHVEKQPTHSSKAMLSRLDLPTLSLCQRIQAANIEGLLFNIDAAIQADIQDELLTHLSHIAKGTDSVCVLRACNSGSYDRLRGAKSSLNLTKTGNQFPVRKLIPADSRFNRHYDNSTRQFATHPIDALRLAHPIHHSEHQFTVQLTITMQELIKELAPDGSLRITAWQPETKKLYLSYKTPETNQHFNGLFMLDLKQADIERQHYSRPWRAPCHQDHWDEKKQIIQMPEALIDAGFDESYYQSIFYCHFPLFFSDETTPLTAGDALHPFKVFANTPQTTESLLIALQASINHHQSVEDCLRPYDSLNSENSEQLEFYQLAKQCVQLDDLFALFKQGDYTRKDILAILNAKTIEQAYHHSARIVTCDWDGLLLGHSTTLDKRYTEVINTVDIQSAFDNIRLLAERSLAYLEHLQVKARARSEQTNIPLTPFDKLILAITPTLFKDILLSPFCLAQAGSISPHEFLFQQLANYTHRQADNDYFGETIDMNGLQQLLDQALKDHYDDSQALSIDTLCHNAYRQLKQQYQTQAISETKQNLRAEALNVNRLYDHLSRHIELAIQNESHYYPLPHPQFDPNVHNLLQHGFDMHSPNETSLHMGSDEPNPWLMILTDGNCLYGPNQRSLIEVLLVRGFLETQVIPVNWRVNMAHWQPVIKRKIELNQTINATTLNQYFQHQRLNSAPLVLPLATLSNNIQQQLSTAILQGESFSKQFDHPFLCVNDVIIPSSANLAIWAPVIEAQLALGIHLRPKLQLAYENYRKAEAQL